jgi:hypothetical protein
VIHAAQTEEAALSQRVIRLRKAFTTAVLPNSHTECVGQLLCSFCVDGVRMGYGYETPTKRLRQRALS